MTRDGKLRAGRTLLAGSYATLALLMIFGAPNHAVDPAWSRHAEVHLQQARAWLVGLCLLSELLVAIPLRRREPWAWWALLLSALMAFGGYFAPSFIYDRSRRPVPVRAGGAGPGPALTRSYGRDEGAATGRAG